MSQRPSAAADPSAAVDPSAARPYGVAGLVLSLVVILVLAALFTVVTFVLVVAGLAAVHGPNDALVIVGDVLAGARDGSRTAERLDVAVGLTAYAAQIAAVLAVARFRGKRQWFALVAWRDWAPRRHWKLVAGLLALTLVWSVVASMAIEHVYPAAKNWVVPPKETPWIVAFLALAVLVGPIGEELLFRGWMYTSLRARFGLRVAVLVTAVLFALAHWESTHLYALAVFPVGLALAIVRERTGSIASTITFHAIYNGVASVLLFVGK